MLPFSAQAHHPQEAQMTFADNIKQLPSVAHLAQLELRNAAGEVVACIPNQPGKAGSLAVYAALAAKYGRIDAAAAEEGLALFAEHTEAARAHPGSHPNIDRLFHIICSGEALEVKLTSIT
jgi:hypothetical protein